MTQSDWTRSIGLVVAGLAVAGMASTIAACSKDREKPAEPTKSSPSASSSAPSSTGAPVTPTEKAPTLTPGGPNSFSPPVLAPAAPTALPGNVVTGG